MPRATANGIDHHYEQQGSVAPLILTHYSTVSDFN